MNHRGTRTVKSKLRCEFIKIGLDDLAKSHRGKNHDLESGANLIYFTLGVVGC